MAVKTKRISTLIESQLPEFISNEYELFGKFVEKYYEAQEVQGGPLDILSNLQKYLDIDYYEKSLLQQNTTLVTSITSSSTTVVLEDASGFPEKNGYVQIGDEIIFYGERTGNTLTNCSRGVSGNIALGDLYEKSSFVGTTSVAHSSGDLVLNISNLFLYAIVKNFESQYLGSFPEKYLRGEVDKRTLIKNIQKFYKAKGTDSSIKFIFNTIVTQDSTNKPEVYKPRDFVYKSSESDWISVYAIKAKIVSGDPKNLIGKQIVQIETEEYQYASAIVDNVFPEGTSDNEQIWNIVVAPETVNGSFAISTKTRLEKQLQSNSGSGKRVNVFSTVGWDLAGEILIGNETISFDDKNATQFIIRSRGSNPATYEIGEPVYKPVILQGSNVKLLTLGVVYNFVPENAQPYSYTGDEVQVSDPGFKTIDPKIVITGSNQPRWFLSQGSSPDVPTIPSINSELSEISTDISAIFEDDQYYYIASSSYPSHKILDGSVVTEKLLDQKLLRIIRKEATRTTEIYKTPKRDVGILLNGVPIFGYKDEESVRFGLLEEIKINTQGSSYVKPPFVLLDGVPNQARALLSGQVVEKIIVDTNTIFPRTPEVLITSGRGAVVRAVVTKGKVTSLIIDNPGEFYSSPPTVRIRDRAGRGRFADFTAVVNTDGKITDFIKNEEGNFYDQATVIVDIIPVGNGASATPFLKEWNKNRFVKLSDNLDTEYGHVFKNYNNVLEYGYGQVANPKSLRISLNDNLNATLVEPVTKTHSPIIGFAYDGNPIYGPFAYENPLDPQSSIIRMTSSYSLNGSRPGGPGLSEYPIGTFVNDFKYTHKSGTLDENNGRFCVTPDFPAGTYAYFLTIDSNQIPQFPYVIGENFYSLPVDSNYNSNISQNDIPKKSKRLFTPGMPGNGDGVIAQISDVKPGFVDSIELQNSSSNFSVNSKVYFDNSRTEGQDAEAIVSSVVGENVNYLQSKENKVVQLTIIQNAYLFANDTLSQPNSGAYGEIVGNVVSDNVIVLKNVVGVFNGTGTFSAAIKTFSILVDQDSSYTAGAILSLTDGINLPIATAEVLETTSRQNVVKIKVLSGTWIVDDDYFLQSNNLFNTSGSRIVSLTSLSDGLIPFDVNQNVALVETSSEHGLGIDDEVVINILPDDTTKTKTYFVRKRLYQKVKFVSPRYSSTIDYTGIGRFEILNGGAYYTPGTYTNIPLTGGSGTGAKANITVSSAGIVSSIVIQDGGSGYKKYDYLSVDDESLSRSGSANAGSSRLVVYLDHVGFAASSTSLILKDALGLSLNDYLIIGKEVIRVSAINGNKLTVLRSQKGTQAVDHFNGQVVSLYEEKYNFSNNFQLSSSQYSGFIKTYDYETQEAIIVFNYTTTKSNAEEVQISTTFFDSSTPKKLVSVVSAEDISYKFEFSEDNSLFVPNPTINIQEFYKYKFDTSHSSLTGTYFDLSPSKTFNLITEEKNTSSVLPGNPGSFTDVKFGFGPRLSSNSYLNKIGTNFANFYYFDKNGIVTSDGSYLKIIQDPLQGTKKITYVTPTRFVYQLDSVPLWDGSGSISYTTTGQFAVGQINSFKVINLGLNYKKAPIIVGCDPNTNFKAKATVLYDYSTNVVTGVRIDDTGSNYTNPKVFIKNGDGVDLSFNVVVRDGKIFSITVNNPGKGYTFTPEIEIIEGEVEAYVQSSTIGVPQSITIIKNGGAFHLDKTVSSSFTSKYIFSLENFSGEYQKGEVVVQVIDGVEVARGIVSEWRRGSNLLKIEKITGIFRQGYQIKSILNFTVGTIKSVFVTTFGAEISSFYDNLGYYTSDRGKLGVANQKLLDSDFYQDYSYVVKSKTPINVWRDLIKSTTHPAGFKLFGQVDIEGIGSTSMPSQQINKNDHFSIIQLWDPAKNKVTVENTRRTVTQVTQKIENQRIKRGVGSAAPSEFNFNEYISFEVSLVQPFNGYYDSDGRLQGRTVFDLEDNNGNPFTPFNAKSLIITLDGILQEPEVAYTVQANTIIFSKPPLGPGAERTGNNLNDITSYKGVTFYGKYFSFKDTQYNTRYLRKIRNIFQRSGRWLDAANQIERNKTFIVEEAVGYGKNKYPTLDWSTKTDDYQRDIGYLLDAYQHDVRFGGNTKTVDYVNIFRNDTDYDYITKNKTKSLEIFKYATKLANLAVRNWDIVENNISYAQGSSTITVEDSERLAIGMYISCGRAYPANTKITAINSATQITVSNNALSTSGSDQATFYLSGINNGTFYDASNLIFANKLHLQEEISNYIYTTYSTLPQLDKEKCKRDLGYLIDAIVYHLRLGGNQKIVEFAQSYYTFLAYPYGEDLTYINRTPTETTAAIAAWDRLASKMILAMRNQLPVSPFTTISPITDNTILVDPINPVCQEVASSINTMIDIVKDIIARGSGVVSITPINTNKSGQWSTTTTYSNYNLIPDPLILSSECADVVSSVNSLYSNVKNILDKKTVKRTYPDYVDGENKTFELYWDDGSEVITEEDEDLFLTINAVLQRPKYTETYPGSDSYYINREVIPNEIVFDVAPIWDQDFSAKSIGEPTAVEKVVGIGVGNYKRLTIDTSLVDGISSGPFLILDVEDFTVQNIEESTFLYVFLDGVLQREGYSYIVSGPNIYFNVPIVKEMKVDMRYLYGRDVGQVLNIYDYSPDTYYAKGTVSLTVTSGLSDLLKYEWAGNKIGEPIHAYQINANGTYNMIGQISDGYVSGLNILNFNVFGAKASIDISKPVWFAIRGFYNTLRISVNVSAATITYELDDTGKTILSDNEQIWSGTYLGKTYKRPFVSLSNNDLIRVDGEEGFRKIKKLPGRVTSKEQRSYEQVSNSFYGTVDIETYNGITRGEGLSVVAKIENGKVTKLEWNRRSYEPLTQPTAYQYYTPPILNFIPVDGNGGGARANVLVSKGQVISIDIIDGGSGYTQAPKVVVARGYDILTERDIGVSLINIGVNSFVEHGGFTAFSTIDVLGNQVSGVNSFTSIFFDSPISTDRVITAEIQLLRSAGSNLTKKQTQLIVQDAPFATDIKKLDVFTNTNQYISVIRGRLADVITSSIVTTNRQITTSFENLIPNDALSNVNYYTTGGFLQVDLAIADKVVYVADTSKFKSNGYLLIGNEIVRYYRKINDRFLNVERGQRSTTAQFWAAGTVILQLPDPASSVFGGVVVVQSASQTATIKGGLGTVSASTTRTEYQDITPPVSIATTSRIIEIDIAPSAKAITMSSLVTTRTSRSYETTSSSIKSFVTTGSVKQLEVDIQSITFKVSSLLTKFELLLIPPPTGVVDGYVETLYWTDPILQRSGSFVTLDNSIYGRHVVQRNNLIVQVRNLSTTDAEYIGTYEVTNAGHTINHFNILADDGVSNVSGITLEELERYYPTLSIEDFELKGKSSYTTDGFYFVLMPPSIQNPVVVPFSTGSIASTIEVPTTTFFPTSGYLFTGSGGLIQYTGKTSTSFTGCTSVSGSTSLIGNSVSFDGTGYLNIASNSAFNYGTGDFTIEFYWRPNALSGTQVLIDQRTASTDVSIYVEMNSSGNIRVFVNGSYRITSSNTCSTSQDNHVAIYRSSGITRVAINGTVTTTSTYTDTNNYASKPFRIGSSWTASSFISGRINSLRVVKGTSLYSNTNFTLPSQITNISGTSLLTCQGNSIKDRSSNNLVITVNGGAVVSNTGKEIIPFEIT